MSGIDCCGVRFMQLQELAWFDLGFMQHSKISSKMLDRPFRLSALNTTMLKNCNILFFLKCTCIEVQQNFNYLVLYEPALCIFQAYLLQVFSFYNRIKCQLYMYWASGTNECARPIIIDGGPFLERIVLQNHILLYYFVWKNNTYNIEP